ncbi:hypothetical protein PANDA_004269, partial [Ailuropoda melanoleuca]
KPKIVKKKTKKFTWHQSDRYVKIKCNCQKPIGIDDRVHRRSRARSCCRSNKKTTYMLPSGFWKFLVPKVKEPEVPAMCNKAYYAEIAHIVSSKNHKAIAERAAQLANRVTN